MCEREKKMSVELRIGGVPEHFNAPWHRALEKLNADQNDSRVNVTWSRQDGGTGAMSRALAANELDVCMMLTEGAIAHIVSAKSGVRIWGMYVVSPLTWGIHTGARNKDRLSCVEDAEGLVYAVSRMGSGSHLMAFVDAKQRGWAAPAPTHFKVVGSLEGSRAALADGSADIWLWEKFTTKHLVDSGEYIRLGTVDTPWPCFAICCSPAAQADPAKMAALERVIGGVREEALAFKANEGDSSIAHLVDEYAMLDEDAREWLASVTWAATAEVRADVLKNVTSTLAEVGVIKEEDVPENSELVTSTCSIIV